jgi:hypothetical protein
MGVIGMQLNARWSVCSSAVLSVVILGCSSEGGKPPPKLAATVPVSGTVTLDGEPLADATVTFLPLNESAYRGAIGRTDASGKYTLTSDIGDGKRSDGAIPEKYKVVVSKFIKADGSPLPPNEPPMMAGAKESLPEAFSMPNKTKLTYEVPAGGGTFDIKVVSK